MRKRREFFFMKFQHSSHVLPFFLSLIFPFLSLLIFLPSYIYLLTSFFLLSSPVFFPYLSFFFPSRVPFLLTCIPSFSLLSSLHPLPPFQLAPSSFPSLSFLPTFLIYTFYPHLLTIYFFTFLSLSLPFLSFLLFPRFAFVLLSHSFLFYPSPLASPCSTS